MRRLRAGDPTVLDELLEEHSSGLIRHAEGFLGNRDDAEDAVQEALVRLWMGRDRLAESGSVKTFCYRILRNICLDILKSPRWKGPKEDPTVLVDPTTPEVEMAAGELAQAAQRAVQSLPLRRKEVFLLVRESGLAYEEVAHTLDLSRQTVANHMSLALRDLRVALHDYLGPSAEDVAPRKQSGPTGDGP